MDRCREKSPPLEQPGAAALLRGGAPPEPPGIAGPAKPASGGPRVAGQWPDGSGRLVACWLQDGSAKPPPELALPEAGAARGGQPDGTLPVRAAGTDDPSLAPSIAAPDPGSQS